MKKLAQKLMRISRVLKINAKHFFSYPSFYSTKQSSKTKIIVFCVNGWGHHGGWTDRLKGIISTYEFANNNGYTFKLWYNLPCELNLVLQPNYNWVCTETDKRFNPFTNKVHYFIDRKDNPLTSIEPSNARKHFVYFNIDTVNDTKNWVGYYKELFLKNSKIESKINSQMQGQDKVVALVFRFLHHLGDYKIKRRTGMTGLKREQVVDKYIKQVKAHLEENYSDGFKFYVFSDSDYFVNRIVDELPFLSNIHPKERDFIHYKNQPETVAVATLERTVFDFTFMSRCNEVLHFIDLPYLYPSGFPKYASFFGDKGAYKKIGLTLKD